MIARRLHPSVNRRGLTFWSQWFCATGASSLAFCLLVFFTFGYIPPSYRVLVVLGVLCSVPIYSALHVYHKRFGYGSGLLRLLIGWAVLMVALIGMLRLCKVYTGLDYRLLAKAALLGFLAQAFTFVPLHCLMNLHARRLRFERTSVIIGTSVLAYTLAKRLRKRVPIVGLVSTDAHAEDVQLDANLPILVGLPTLTDLVKSGKVRRVYIALSLSESARIEALYRELLDLNVDVVWVPDFSGMTLLNPSFSQIEQFPAIYLNETPLSSHPASAFGKELFDRVVALITLIILFPVLLAVAIAVKLSSPGPVFFRQPRHGCNGTVIQVWKFRSMRQHDDEAVKQATQGDPRVTRVGAFLRRSSMDELPQLINVLRGEMALVGPRPHAITHNNYYGDKILAYMARHRIKPGITGLAQVNGYRGETETLEKMQRRVEQDLAYINHWSLWLDIKILLKTPFTLFSRNIY
ncbi:MULTISPECIES: undecaprenyl-phosphate glucose phosphotransferase [unclassified Pseudomonas]|uniref:undecaprenyl-phosphate glucose phosphotransferase n=1 Tax=unclassified Pseudomonas TaxID=196821 RepID=UPI002AC9119C|nr:MULTISPECIES: undecaprenyl-phosphate glucose phosphotransferase [unclassified Pseudomonas]MEB0039872.1 undecaprenyl-phosphate glucose phosphotransferase [Pseudomonas sp. MH10]MEB0077186.1 undecaprenyl-phosphate glucose phosphotransferase [Pseudomonas sp. MH10out]MEB0091483.1 undecaprenyl-phosphate glucose phosphotransferase [Pseudomonas sp. CCI4.2]MEB0101533.1 undecaprenyl-phosphate glucose phosphotransferase [Pseudomonas sp. CCI3.2]MEB0120644.1 undecaprenyl-phosphate glucose phosphotransfe